MSRDLVAELAGVSGLPRRNVRRLVAALADAVRLECGRGGSVALPGLGAFGARMMAARTVKNTIAGQVGTARQAVTVPKRLKLVFIPKPSGRVVEQGRARPVFWGVPMGWVVRAFEGFAWGGLVPALTWARVRSGRVWAVVQGPPMVINGCLSLDGIVRVIDV